MNFFSDRNVPYMNPAQQRQKTLIAAVIVLVAIALIVLIMMLFFSDDSLGNQLGRTAQSQSQTKQTAELVEEFATNSSIGNFATTLNSVATSNVNRLSEFQQQYANGGFTAVVGDLSDERASLEAAQVSGALEEVAAQLLSAQLQDDIEQLNELEKLTSKQDLLAAIKEMREDSAELLGELEDGRF